MAAPILPPNNILNYGELKKAIIAYANRTDLNDVVPLLIHAAEKRIFRVLRTPSNEQKTYFDALETTYRFNTPDRCLDIRNIRTIPIPDDPQETDFTSAVSLRYVPISLFYTNETQSGSFTRELNNIWFKNGVAKGTRVIISYWIDLSGLNDDDDTNEVLLKNWDLYLFGALAELAPYLVDDKRVSLWENKFTMALENSAKFAKIADWKASPTMMRIP